MTQSSCSRTRPTEKNTRRSVPGGTRPWWEFWSRCRTTPRRGHPLEAKVRTVDSASRHHQYFPNNKRKKTSDKNCRNCARDRSVRPAHLHDLKSFYFSQKLPLHNTPRHWPNGSQEWVRQIPPRLRRRCHEVACLSRKQHRIHVHDFGWNRQRQVEPLRNTALDLCLDFLPAGNATFHRPRDVLHVCFCCIMQQSPPPNVQVLVAKFPADA